ncbi:YchJ family protein [Roseibacillus persicicus]|uniref:YchJ family protein n=1 Tax=Roseibacillus persicicus TaxID=454148 RepID=UPI0028102EC9|nr:YchJ family metal-binding protein [Roseibacillus persicicus]MDQ8191708.1 YchJ family metal-binding protein [Roseibacillus persicicus]
MAENLEKIPREREVSPCPCTREKSYAECCMPFHYGRAKPETAEQLMRSRYTAYFFRLVDYLVATKHPDKRMKNLAHELEKTIWNPSWRKLTIVGSSKGGKEDKTGKVEFIAKYSLDGQDYELHEKSRFRRYKGKWMYYDEKG